VTISRQVLPEGDDWNAAIQLRDTVRREILSHLGEPDLAGSFAPFAEMGETDEVEKG
jgi:hypothetical protein